jgi:hypothetical protein
MGLTELTMKKLILIILLVQNILTGYSLLNIGGRIVSADSQPIDAAYISVTDSSSLFVKGTLSDNESGIMK